MVKDLTARQRQILEVIEVSVTQRGYPPSVREIGEEIGLTSPSSVHRHIKNLEVAGYLRRDEQTFRGIELLRTASGEPMTTQLNTVAVPLVGEIAAGNPLLAEENIETHLPLPEELVGGGTLFALRVVGDSMLDAGILPGDTVVVRQQPTVEQGEICAALINGEATVKYFQRDGEKIRLLPANDAYSPIEVPVDSESAIMGKVVASLRRM